MKTTGLRGTVVVTGGAGLIGTALCRALMDLDCERVIAIDPRRSPSLIPLPEAGPRFCMLRTHIADPRARQAINGSSCVFHLAANTQMRWSPRDARRDLDGGLDLTLQVLEALRDSPSTMLVLCSSSAVYGTLASRLVCEDHGPLLPCSTYGAAKLASEAWASAYAQLVGFPLVICRLGNIVSETLDRGALLDIVRQVHFSGVVRLLGNGNQARTYLGAVHCAEALIYLAHTGRHSTPLIVNVSGRGLVWTRDLVRIASEVVRRPARVDVASMHASGWLGDVPVVDLDVSRLERLGWHPPPSEDAVRRAAAGIARTLASQDDQPV